MLLDERVGQRVIPGTRGRDHLPLQLGERDVRNLALGDVHREVEASRIGLAEREVIIDRLAVEALLEQTLQPHAKLGADAIAGQRNRRRDATALEVGAHEQLHVALLLEPQQRHHRPPQVLLGCREQLVLGEAVEDRDDRLVVVRAGEQILGFHDVLELAPHKRDVARWFGVGLAREQAQQAQLADDAAVGVHPLHAHVIHLHAPVHGRLAVGLRHHQ